ncbi:MAG TPA: molybdopterin-dependent oxidoreductase [Candidatus Dormibacteraeota bacterium]|nr:molybdopterin-dependent oxidoreductase [Candidatus Dormibacteraeota bacterium]
MGRATLAGLVAGIVGVAAMEFAALLGLPSLPALVQEPLLSHLPGPLFGFLIDRLQHAGKVLEEVGLLLAMLATLTGLGAAAEPLARKTSVGAATLALAAVPWLLVCLVLLPMTGQGVLGLGGGTLLIPIAWALVFALDAVTWRALREEVDPTGTVDPGRRRLLQLLPIGIAAGGLALIGAIRAPDWLGQVLAPAESEQGEPVPAITPVQRFYVVSKNLQDPTVPISGWALEVTGLTGRPLHLTYAELTAIPSVTEAVTLECISNDVGGPLMSTGRFTGVPLRDLLVMAEPGPGARAVNFWARDGYTETLPLMTALAEPFILVAYRLNGIPLPVAHGFPARMVIPGRYGMKGPKWLDRIEVADAPRQGFWEQQGWDSQAVVKTTSRIDVPPNGAILRLGTVFLAGVAFAGTRGIQAVEWSADGGRSWSPAELEAPPSPLTWRRWRARWTPGQPGEYTLVVRARDGRGDVQTPDRAPTFPAGATGYDVISVSVA